MFSFGLTLFQILTGQCFYKLTSGGQFNGGINDLIVISNLLQILEFRSKSENKATNVLKSNDNIDHQKISKEFRKDCLTIPMNSHSRPHLKDFKRYCVQ